MADDFLDEKRPEISLATKALAAPIQAQSVASETRVDLGANSNPNAAGSNYLAAHTGCDLESTNQELEDLAANLGGNSLEAQGFSLPEAKPEPVVIDPGLNYIFERTRHKKCLVFVNSREQCEAVTSTLRSYCEHFHEPDRYLIHHGNISAAYRETAEMLMRDETKFMTTVTTSTLELGIDIGRLERAFQIDAPWTVSSFLQRMGRTGRRDAPPEMWFVIQEELSDPRDSLPTTFPWKLLQAIALVQLYIEERWVEPPTLDRLPYSLVYHQTMSILAAEGELSPKALASRILSLQYFHRVSQDDYRLLLKHMLSEGHIERTERGGLIVGLAGERVINSYKFYIYEYLLLVFHLNQNVHLY